MTLKRFTLITAGVVVPFSILLFAAAIAVDGGDPEDRSPLGTFLGMMSVCIGMLAIPTAAIGALILLFRGRRAVDGEVSPGAVAPMPAAEVRRPEPPAITAPAVAMTRVPEAIVPAGIERAVDDGDAFEQPLKPGTGRTSVCLLASGPSKISVIKIIRAATGLGLAESKALVDFPPCLLLSSIAADEARRFAAEIVALGGVAEALPDVAVAELLAKSAPPPPEQHAAGSLLEVNGRSKVSTFRATVREVVGVELKVHVGYSPGLIAEEDATIASIRSSSAEDAPMEASWSPSMTVAEFEAAIAQGFGFKVQVLSRGSRADTASTIRDVRRAG
jgi:large subunit ribosomal protein L7/L12